MDLKEVGKLNLMTALIYGEARGENIVGKIGVGWVVKNRAIDTRWPRGIEDVILQPGQFSCFNSGDKNFELVCDTACKASKYLDKLDFRESRWVAFGVLNGWIRDVTGGANHYHELNMEKYPYWSDNKKVTKIIGDHIFYKL